MAQLAENGAQVAQLAENGPACREWHSLQRMVHKWPSLQRMAHKWPSLQRMAHKWTSLQRMVHKWPSLQRMAQLAENGPAADPRIGTVTSRRRISELVLERKFRCSYKGRHVMNIQTSPVLPGKSPILSWLPWTSRHRHSNCSISRARPDTLG